jgi:ATP-dependent helicase Lhr and Lhr-like helicase
VSAAFDRLHPALQHHIVNSLGWRDLRPLQQAAIEPVLNGDHAILLAPTAGGKTEAAVFPVLSRMMSEDWSRLSVLYLCPIKALLNNLLPRLEYYCGLVGRRVALWHGDIGAAHRARIAADPPDVLLTTPESLESMLVSSRIDHRSLLGNVQTIIIDEVHAFAGDDRGWHLLALLERLSHLTSRELQRLGLSATVGNPEALCDWLAGPSERPRRVLNPPADGATDSDVQVDWVGSLKNAALVISRLHRGEKRLVFVDSRSRVEQLAVELRGLGVNTFISHSSLSLEERRAAEAAFAEGNDCVIVATSTLELGIDVGDLDRVIQVDAPFTVSSFLQRIGRTGRRSGSARNCLFLATTEDAFLRAVGLLHLWHSGYVEPIEPPAMPLHIYAQQVMALCLQERGLVAKDISRWIGRMPGFASVDAGACDQLLDHMLATGILHSDGGVLGIGRQGEEAFGYQHFMSLLSVFTSPPMVKVYHGRQELGEVHELTFAVAGEGPALLTLGGRNWSTLYVDWPRRRAFVEPTEMKGRSQWLGAGQPMHFALCQAIRDVLVADGAHPKMSKRAAKALEKLREEFCWVAPGATALVIDRERSATWWTFAGIVFNAAAAEVLRSSGKRALADNLAVRVRGPVDVEQVQSEIRTLLGEPLVAPLDSAFIQELKFSECLHAEMINAVLCERYLAGDAIRVLVRSGGAIRIVEVG